MADIFEQTTLFRAFRQFCMDTSGDLADKFNRSMDAWDPHVLLLLNGLLFVGSQLQGHTDQRMSELLQQFVYHFAPGEVMARPAVHMVNFQADVTRFQPGVLPRLEPLSALRDDDKAVIGHLGEAPFHLQPGISVTQIEPIEEDGRQGLAIHLESEVQPYETHPPIRCYLLDGGLEANYQFLDVLSFPGVGCREPGVSVVSTPQSFSFPWQCSPWYKEQLRFLDPYPGELDLFFEIRGLTAAHWTSARGAWTCKVEVLLPFGCELYEPRRFSTLKARANTTPIYEYEQMPDVLLSGYEQEVINRRADRVVFLRAWEKNQELFQPGALYTGDMLEQSEPHVWFWTPADSSPLIAELRSADREVRIESIVALMRKQLWGRKRIENILFEWDAAPKTKKQYDAGVSLFPVGRLGMLPRLGPDEIKDKLWGWLANNFLLTEDHGQLSTFLTRSLRDLGLEDVTPGDLHEVESSAITFTHEPGRGLVPAFGVELTLPRDIHSQQAGHGTRGKLWAFLKRFSRFLQERLPPHLRLVISVNHQDERDPGWCLRGEGELL